VDDRLAARWRSPPDPSPAAVASYAAYELFERFTERARQVVVLAQDEARALRHNYIGTEHLLLGLLREEEGVAARALEALDVSLEDVRYQTERIVGSGDEVTTGMIPFTPRAKKVLELALREALLLGHNYIGTEHILLGLIREGDGVAMRILLDLDVNQDQARNEVVRTMASPGGRPQPVAPLASDLQAEIERVRAEKEAAVEAQDLGKVASLRVRERNLLRLGRAGDVEGFWEEAKRELPTVGVRLPPRPLPRPAGRAAQWRATAATLTHGPPPHQLTGSATAYFLIGWCSFAVALGLGVLVGWLIWGH
jgi:Clp amino terminal domain, pathogenicity island component